MSGVVACQGDALAVTHTRSRSHTQWISKVPGGSTFESKHINALHLETGNASSYKPGLGGEGHAQPHGMGAGQQP